MSCLGRGPGDVGDRHGCGLSGYNWLDRGWLLAESFWKNYGSCMTLHLNDGGRKRTKTASSVSAQRFFGNRGALESGRC